MHNYPQKIKIAFSILLSYNFIVINIFFVKEAIMKRIIEVRSAEGGADAQLFVSDLINAYIKLATRKG